MPLDGHSYLASYGWSGKGNGLRKGAISRPLAIPQKKTLAGLGKDRDEAFPFWDHLFNAAAKAITIKVTSDDESDNNNSTPGSTSLEFKRTSTGVISNRRPVSGTPASGLSTPDPSGVTISVIPRLSLLAAAKREAAKKGLYARFFRGPTLGPDSADIEDPTCEPESSVQGSENAALPEGEASGKEEKKSKGKKRKLHAVTEDKEARRERKRLKREIKEARRATKKTEDQEADELDAPVSTQKAHTKSRRRRKESKEQGEVEPSEEKRRKEKKEKRRQEGKNRPDPSSEDQPLTASGENVEIPDKSRHPKKRVLKAQEPVSEETSAPDAIDEKSLKKKRRRKPDHDTVSS